jgi:hypothetical protein
MARKESGRLWIAGATSRGVVTSWRQAPDGREHIVAFLLPDDLFGLSAKGRYTNSTKASPPSQPIVFQSLPCEAACRKTPSWNSV